MCPLRSLWVGNGGCVGLGGENTDLRWTELTTLPLKTGSGYRGSGGKERTRAPRPCAPRGQMHLVTKSNPHARGSGRAQLWLDAGLKDHRSWFLNQVHQQDSALLGWG